MDAAVSAVKQKLYADREKLTISNRVRVCMCVWAWLYPCQHVRCFSVYKDSTLGKKLVQRNTNHKWRHIHVHDECMKTLTTVVYFSWIYIQPIFFTLVLKEREKQSVSNSFHFVFFPGLPLPIRMWLHHTVAHIGITSLIHHSTESNCSSTCMEAAERSALPSIRNM